MMKLPPPLNWLWWAWMKISAGIGFVMSKILLTILWAVGFGAYAIAYRLSSLFQKKQPSTSYWISATPDFPESMKHPF